MTDIEKLTMKKLNNVFFWGGLVALGFIGWLVTSLNSLPARVRESTTATVTSTSENLSVVEMDPLELRVIWYDVRDGQVTNVTYAARRGNETCFFHRDTGEIIEGKSSDPSIPYGKANLKEWKRVFLEMETNGMIPTLPLSFIEGVYKVDSFDWASQELSLSLLGTNGWARIEKRPFSEFDSLPTLGPTFRFAKLSGRDDAGKLYPVTYSEEGGGGRFTLSMK